MLSFHRKCIVDELSKIDINGKIIDLGGSRKSNMYKYIKSKYDSITIVNFDENYGCDIVADITEKIPVDDESYDNLLCLSVLEHIYKYENVIQESYRILKKRGKAYYSIPFLHKVHGSPYDYFRYTHTTLETLFLDNHFSNVEITPMGYGPFSACYSLTEGLYPKFLRYILKNVSISMDKIVSRFTNTYSKDTFPIGYFIVATK